jgi:hypothetical protein
MAVKVKGFAAALAFARGRNINLLYATNAGDDDPPGGMLEFTGGEWTGTNQITELQLKSSAAASDTTAPAIRLL